MTSRKAGGNEVGSSGRNEQECHSRCEAPLTSSSRMNGKTKQDDGVCPEDIRAHRCSHEGLSRDSFRDVLLM